MNFSILLLAALNSPLQPWVDAVDRVEVNHFYNDDGALVFDQIIWWNWCFKEDRFQVVEWRLLKGVRVHCEESARKWLNEHPNGPPYVSEWIGGHATPKKQAAGLVSEWYDEKTKKYRRVVAKIFLETWTDFDRELVERELLPEKQRSGFSGITGITGFR